MSLTQSLLLIALLIAASAFFSLAEISLAASRRCACASWPTTVTCAPTRCCGCRSTRAPTSPWCRSG
jgi:hypothetical protein